MKGRTPEVYRAALRGYAEFYGNGYKALREERERRDTLAMIEKLGDTAKDSEDS
jgi:hypothetical protein